MKVKLSIALVFSFLVSFLSQANAIEFEQVSDVSFSFDGLISPEIEELQGARLGTERQLNGSITGFWNAYLYPTENTQFDFRFGLSANGDLYHLNPVAPFESGGLANYRFDDIEPIVASSDNNRFVLYQQLDQLFFSWYSPVADISLGRQPISFGLAKVFSPIDIIQPAQLNATDRSYRPGVDAIRTIRGLGAVSELDLGYVFGEDTALFARLKTFAYGSDIEFTALQINNKHNVLSVGVNSGLGAFGLWQETALLNSDDETNYRVTVGFDTTLFDDLYVMNEWHFNGMGSSEEYTLNNSDKSFYELGAVLTQANWYTSLQMNYPVNILTSINIGGTVNLDDGSALLNGSINYSLGDELSLSASVMVPISEVSDDGHTLAQEYGAYPTVGSVELKWFF